MHAAVSFSDHKNSWTAARVDGLVRRIEPFVNLVGVIVGLGWLLALLFQHLQLVAQPSPHEFNESGEWYTTWLFDQGRNPYGPEELIGSSVFFGPLYHWVVLAFKPLFGIGYPAHRMVNLLCLAGTLWLLVTRMRRLGTSLGIALLSAALFYWACLQNIMLSARADALGLLLFLLAIFVPWENGYSRRSVLVGLACTFLAIHCKAYFALALLPLVAGVGLVRSWREAALDVLILVAAIAASMWALGRKFPLYYVETVIMQKHSVEANSTDPEIAIMHTQLLYERAWPYLLLLAVAAGPFLRRSVAALWLVRPAGRTSLAAPEARTFALALLAGLFVFHLLLVNFYMGINGGALFTYHLHLIFPPMLLLAAAAASSPRARVVFGAGLIAFVMTLLHTREVPDGSPGYHRLKEIIEANDPVLDSTSSAIEILATHGRPIHSNGYTLCLPFTTMYDRADWDPNVRQIRDAYEKSVLDAEAKIVAHEYKVILTTDDRCYFGRIELVHEHYERVERVDLPMYFGASDVEVWKPKASAAVKPTAP
jgi:hypothetical protein